MTLSDLQFMRQIFALYQGLLHNKNFQKVRSVCVRDKDCDRCENNSSLPVDKGPLATCWQGVSSVSMELVPVDKWWIRLLIRGERRQGLATKQPRNSSGEVAPDHWADHLLTMLLSFVPCTWAQQLEAQKGIKRPYKRCASNSTKH